MEFVLRRGALVWLVVRCFVGPPLVASVVCVHLFITFYWVRVVDIGCEWWIILFDLSRRG